MSAKAMFTVADIKTKIRTSCYESKNPELMLVPNPETFGLHNSNIDAKRAAVTLYHPELKDSSDDHIKRVSKEFFTGKGAIHKIVRFTPEQKVI
ncbi:hypothetical protein QTV43_000066 [Vibrio vulnificus]|nr:hypothetical protein [Vibrio vulnificus]